MTDRWATGLPEHLVDPAWAALYLTTTSLSGQVSVFVGGGDLDRDLLYPYDPIDPDRLILARMAALGLIRVDIEPGEPVMVRVLHDLGQVQWNAKVRQPHAS
jgi:hypothetical protein